MAKILHYLVFILLQNTTGNTSSLSKYLKEFDKRISDTKNNNALLEVLIANATAHANYLKERSDFLQSLLRDPNKYAEKAIEARKAYDSIVKAIEKILELAREANKNSQDALREVSLSFPTELLYLVKTC